MESLAATKLRVSTNICVIHVDSAETISLLINYFDNQLIM